MHCKFWLFFTCACIYYTSNSQWQQKIKGKPKKKASVDEDSDDVEIRKKKLRTADDEVYDSDEISEWRLTSSFNYLRIIC